MTPSKPDPNEPEKPAAPTVPSPPEPAPAPAASAENASSLYEPYPGAAFFHGGRHSPIVSAMAHRLHEEGCSNDRLGPDWTNAHRDAFATWQKQLRPKEGGNVSGIPDQVAWDKLRVPRISPLPKETS
jgi:hypothetical protein